MKIIIALLIIIVLMLFYTAYLIKQNYAKKDIKETSTTEPKEEKTYKKSNQYRKTQKMKWRDKMLDISMIPKTVELDKETLLPVSIKREYGFGRRFNSFIIADDNYHYHRSTCPNVKGKRKQLVHKYVAVCKGQSCNVCMPDSHIDDWYIQFLNTNFEKITTYEEFRNQMELPELKLLEYEN